MAITDIISEEEISTPNMEIAQGGPDDFMTDDEMDPYQDPELQQLLESLPGEQAEVLMQLIKEFKAMVAQGFQGEFEDFVKMKMASAQGGPEEFMTEDEMQIGPEELQSQIPMGQQVAQGGRIGYGLGSWVKGKLGLGRKEGRAEASPDRAQVAQDPDMLGSQILDIFKNKFRGGDWRTNFRNQWMHPFIKDEDEEEVQYAQGGRIGYDQGGGIMDVVEEEQVETGPTSQQLIMKWLNDRGLPITPENIQKAIMEMAREGQAPARQPQTDMSQMEEISYTGELDPRVVGEDISEKVTPDVAEAGIMQVDDPTLYDDDEQTRWLEKGERLKGVRGGVSPDSYIWMMDEWAKEGRQKGWVPQEDYLNYQKNFLGEGGEQLTGEIERYQNLIEPRAQGGRIGYDYGGGVTADAPGIMSQVSPSRTQQIEKSQLYDDAMQKIINKFIEKFPDADHTNMTMEDIIANLQMEGVSSHSGGDILSFAAGMDMITPESVRGSMPGVTRGIYEEEHQFDHPVDEMRGRPGYQYGNEVTADAPGVASQVPEAQVQQIYATQKLEEAWEKIQQEFLKKFPGIDTTEMTMEDMVAMMQAEGVQETLGAGILDVHEGMKMITPESVRGSMPGVTRGMGEPDYLEHQFDHPVDEMMGRPGYGLAGLVKSVFKGAKKGVKSLTKSIKKFAKSDLGKMALMYMATAGMANIGAGGWSGAQPWSGGQWLRPSNVMGLGKTGWGNVGKSLTNLGLGTAAGGGGGGGKEWLKNVKIPGVETMYDKPAGFLAGVGQSIKNNPFPWIAGTAGAAGLYTAANPAKDNLDSLMRNYEGEVSEWDKMIANMRAGEGPTTPFSTSDINYPYPNYMDVADGGRIRRAEGGLMDLGGLEKDYRAEGGFVPIGGKEKADDVPARLSVNEFVFTADAVRNAGGGDVDRGSEVMQNIMTNLEQGGSISEESQGLEGARDMFEVSERLSEVV